MISSIRKNINRDRNVNKTAKPRIKRETLSIAFINNSFKEQYYYIIMANQNTKVNMFKNKKVLIMGLGLIGGGVSAVKFFCRQEAEVLVTDLRTKKELRESIKQLKGLPVKFVLGKHRKKDFIWPDLIIKNPAVPNDSFYLKIAKKNNVSIKNDIEIFFELFDGQAIGVTGTKGKSTTATLIYLFLKTKYPDVYLAGNIGKSPLDIIEKTNKNSKVVLELSSFELEDLEKSPNITVITTLFEDHLNRYKNFKEYVEAKKTIFKYQNKSDILILNKDNIYTKRLAKEANSKIYFFSEKGLAQAAIKTAEVLKVSNKNIEKVLNEFKGIPHRQEFVAEKSKVKYFNDTSATTPQSVILAIKMFKKRFSNIVLIAGGEDKNLNYKELAKEIEKNKVKLILLPGTGSKKLEKELRKTKINKVKSMVEAVKKASNLANNGDAVLLSPGAASFNLFENEFDRGRQFMEFVKKL